MKRLLYGIGILIGTILLAFALFIIYIDLFAGPSTPDLAEYPPPADLQRVSDHEFHYKNNWLRTERPGLWELYVEGAPYERGVAIGEMTKDILKFQELVFVGQLEQYVPNQWYQKLLLRLIKFYNRNLTDHIPEEYLLEIYGVSQYLPDSLDRIGDKYQRKLNYHAAHDIGHAFQNMGFVSGCTALTVRDSATSGILLGRNFDFSAGADFAANKVMMAMRPDSGYAFLSYSWAGMMGVVTGMNEKGLAVALNAGPSDMPKGAKSPVTLIAREILQYASTIDEAVQIAKKRDVFVAENFIIGSGDENRVVVIEKSPGVTQVFRSSPEELICSNHFQSDELKDSETNSAAQEMTSTAYRYNRVKELKKELNPNNLDGLVKILRNTRGEDNIELGMGNEMAVNILSGHHSVIFDLNKRTMYVTASPNQLGTYYGYQVDSIFSMKYKNATRLWIDTIASDPRNDLGLAISFNRYLNQKKALEKDIANDNIWTSNQLNTFISLNPKSYETHMLVGQYYVEKKLCDDAVLHLEQALTLPIAWQADRELMEEWLADCDK